jgi:hypothetical protein
MNAIKSLFAVGLASVCFNLAAQTVPAVAAPLPASAVTAEQKAAIAEMLEAMNFKQTMSQMAAAMAQSIPQMTEKLSAPTLAKLPPEEQSKLRAQSLKASQSSLPRMLALYSDPAIVSGMEDIMGRIYLKRFSLDEIKAITVFYKSDAGKKMLSSTPQIMQDSMPEMMALIAPRMSEIAESIAKEARENLEAIAAENKAKAVAK